MWSARAYDGIRAVAAYADAYVNELGDRWSRPQRLMDDWWLALRFWFGHSFYQGRSDVLSSQFESRATNVLDGALKIGTRSGPHLGHVLTEGGSLDQRLLDGGVTKRNDRRLVLSTLALIRDLPQNNIVTWSLNEIQSGNILRVYQRIDAVVSVGDKITSFYLRDLDLIYDLRGALTPAAYLLTQPIDVWVARVSKELGILPDEETSWVNRMMIVESCGYADVDPNRYNVGAWWVGTRGLIGELAAGIP